jgi:hypothetical protein
MNSLTKLMSRPTTKKGRGSAFSNAETEILLSLVEKHLPFGGDAWEKVGDEFRAKHTNSTVVRDTESLRNKYKALKNHRKPTGLKISLLLLLPLLRIYSTSTYASTSTTTSHFFTTSTGDPECPPFVKRAKRLYKEIEAHADVIGCFSDEEVISFEFKNY